MKIGIDCRTVLARKTGDRTYTLNLLRGLAQLQARGELPPGWRFHLLLDAPDAGGVLPVSPVFAPAVLSASNARLWTMLALPRYARRARLDLIHLQYIAPLWSPCPVVTTIHDVVWRAMPETFPTTDRLVMNALMPGTVRRARRILTVSEDAKGEIARHLRVARRKISVTPNAVEAKYHAPVAPARIAAVRAQYGIGDAPYILSVGVLQPRKNVPRLIEAFAQIKAAHRDWPHRLVITGKKGWGDQKSEIRNPKSEITYTDYVADDELPALYAGAEVFAYPSLYEGFGLPILEAMACGCPVVTSNRSSMPEVAGDAAELVDPSSVSAIASGLKRLLQDDARREELKRRGRQRAAYFTTERQAKTTLAAYRLK
ncbi:MAG TPA: glycosyltransferase family 1 protein [Abditibacteriaceae bacterium]|nr:glycosyltransferase family 1 protein [Abditibacteriaceae bacterium]